MKDVIEVLIDVAEELAEGEHWQATAIVIKKIKALQLQAVAPAAELPPATLAPAPAPEPIKTEAPPA